MKLRCTTNSIRLRLRKSDVERLMRDGRITESVALPDGPVFSFSLCQESRDSICAEWDQFALRIILPQPEARQWAATERVGIESFLPLSDGNQLHVLIEKDFPCKDRPEEDKSDTFQELAAREENTAC